MMRRLDSRRENDNHIPQSHPLEVSIASLTREISVSASHCSTARWAILQLTQNSRPAY